jgi:hypothetical protein
MVVRGALLHLLQKKKGTSHISTPYTLGMRIKGLDGQLRTRCYCGFEASAFGGVRSRGVRKRRAE